MFNGSVKQAVELFHTAPMVLKVLICFIGYIGYLTLPWFLAVVAAKYTVKNKDLTNSTHSGQ